MDDFLKIGEKLNLARHRRSLALVSLGLAIALGWGVYGANILAALNPELKRELALAEHPPLDVWITPPDYIHTAPLIISTPAGARFEHETLTLPQGSIISAHLAEQGGDAPELIIDGHGKQFTTDAHGDFATAESLSEGDKLIIRRGWEILASWKIKVIPDNPPDVTLIEPPVMTEGKTLRIAYDISDAFGVDEVALRITPLDPLPGATNAPIDIPLPSPAAKDISRIDYTDLTSRSYAGQNVKIQIVATNEAGKQSLSNAFPFALPERSFFHPIARILIEERKKLLLHPDDEKLRNETANIMAGIAHEIANYRGDPVVLMALRSGAVRLVLGRNREAAISVNDILWETATRIEDGATKAQQHTLQDARQDLAGDFGN